MLLLLGLAHAVSDGAAGLLLGRLALELPAAQAGGLALLYNLLAFPLQAPLGMLVDWIAQRASWLGRRASLLALSLALMAAALLLPGAALWRVGCAGLGSALFHVCGGALVLQDPRRFNGAAVFTAPGVVGLALGGAAAALGLPLPGWLPAAVLLFLAALAWRLPEQAAEIARHPVEPDGFETHDLLMIALLGSIALRSAVWTAFDILLHGQVVLLLAAGAAAGLGKLLGGLIADRAGWRRWTLGSLALAAPLLALGGSNPWTLLPGLALLQSLTPLALVGLARLLPGRPATAAGLGLGLGIGLGGLLAAAGLAAWLNSPWLAAGASLCCGLLLATGMSAHVVQRGELRSHV